MDYRRYDPAARRVFETAQKDRLMAAVQWGIGADNVDFAACKDRGIPIINTPMMFGAAVATAFVVSLTRELFTIDHGVRRGNWPKPADISLIYRRVGVIGLGDIGRHTVTRMQALGMKVVAYDPGIEDDAEFAGMERATWPEAVEDLDFLVFTCALNKQNFRMLNADVLARCKKGVRIVNVGRGPLINEAALVAALQSGHVYSSAGLDLFKVEPLPMDSPLRGMNRCIFGSHNSSNTIDGVICACYIAIGRLGGFYAPDKEG